MYANYLHVGVGRPVQVLDYASEILGAVGDISCPKALAARRVDPIIVNFKAMKSRIRRCEENDLACCKVLWDDKLLGIRPIEHEANRVVQHTASHGEYYA